MEKYEINKYLEKFNTSVEDLNHALNPTFLESRIKELEAKITEDGFWDDQKSSSKVIEELNNHKEKFSLYKEVRDSYQEIQDAYEMYNEDPEDEETNLFLEELIHTFEVRLDEITIQVILNGKYDNKNCLLEIHPGAGGTESMDWADMLFRMYQRYAQNHKFQFKVIDYLAGEEAGIKSVTIQISGKNAYGFLKAERGVHRLVRISPFDANKRRHTSFASVDVSPIIDDITDVEIKDEDIRVDTFMSSGHGGQGVNTTYSAVRVTHIPTGIAVNCQNERSQIQNKEEAMMVLRSKLIDIEIRKQEEELAKEKGNSSLIAFGSQIRSYVFCPYTLVKDHRTNVENGNVGAVMDGDLDNFIYGYLKWMVTK